MCAAATDGEDGRCPARRSRCGRRSRPSRSSTEPSRRRTTTCAPRRPNMHRTAKGARTTTTTAMRPPSWRRWRPSARLGSARLTRRSTSSGASWRRSPRAATPRRAARGTRPSSCRRPKTRSALSNARWPSSRETNVVCDRSCATPRPTPSAPPKRRRTTEPPRTACARNSAPRSRTPIARSQTCEGDYWSRNKPRGKRSMHCASPSKTNAPTPPPKR